MKENFGPSPFTYRAKKYPNTSFSTQSGVQQSGVSLSENQFICVFVWSICAVNVKFRAIKFSLVFCSRPKWLPFTTSSSVLNGHSKRTPLVLSVQ